MRLRIHHALFAGFIGVLGLLVVMIVVLVGSGLRRDLRATFRDGLESQLALGEWILARSSGADPDSLMRRITARTGYRATLIDTAGVVLADSYVAPGDVAMVESHASRPEVRGALSGEVTFSERTSTTVDEPLLYGARPARLDGEPVVLRLAAPQSEIEATVDRVQRRVALTGLVAAALALLAAWWLSVAFARPLVVLAERARALAVGDFSRKAPRGRRIAELEDLAAAFNRLTDELQARLGELGRERDEMGVLIDCMAEGVVALDEQGRLLRMNRTARTMLAVPELPHLSLVGAAVRQPEIRRALEQSVVEPFPSREVRLGRRHLLLSSRALDHGGAVTTFLDITELRRLEEVRSDFVANASHELKTPLTTIRGFAETLLDDEPPEELRRQFLSAIHANTLRLQRMADDLLDLSRIESGGWIPHSEPVRLAEAVQEAWEPFRTEAEGKPITFGTSGDGTARADRQGLLQIFRNLMENALRHTPAGGSIRVAVAPGPEGLLTVTVTDTGEGIPSSALPRIFERFYRADSSRAREVGGTGLGLSIVRHLVESMGGKVEAESQLGRGTTIRFTVPRSP